MSDWMDSEITLGLASVVLGMLAGRVCAWGACYLPTHLEHQWQRDAREILGLDPEKPNDLQPTTAPSRETWAAQIIGAVLSLVVTMYFGPTMQAFFVLLFTWCLLILSLIDSKHHLLPDALVLPGLWGGLALNSFGLCATLQDALWGCVVGYLSLWSSSQLTRLITGRVNMGAGDLKLLAMIGAWGGWHILPTTVLLALLASLLASVPRMLKSSTSRPTVIPFGPYISVAGWASFTLQLNSIP
ncbi:A24 family peptidase [Pseudomonas soli]|uniref:prepilin peptidase n=1 Tax=Pseudomonas soli TaxID=1306993 RepID=UPI00299D2EF4|nr:A24 family peptidase [Pseudomonas soli]MDW9404370.1 prepilin peptidase [Pseudomonas soli]